MAIDNMVHRIEPQPGPNLRHRVQFNLGTINDRHSTGLFDRPFCRPNARKPKYRGLFRLEEAPILQIPALA
jgi:hypothetical protein